MEYDRSEISITGKRRVYVSENGTDWELIPGTTGFTEPESETEMQKLTNDSTEGYVHDYVLGMVDPGTGSFTYMFQRTVYAMLEEIKQEAADADLRATALRHWKFEKNDGSTWVFRGYLMKNGGSDEGQGEEPSEVECEIQAIELATFTAGDGTPEPIES